MTRTRPIRVLRVIPALDFGGVETLFVIQAQSGDHKRFPMRVVTFHKDMRAAAAVRAAGVHVDCLNVSPSVKSPRSTIALSRYIREYQPDIVHGSVPEASFHVGTLGPKTGAKTILDDAGMPYGTWARTLVWGLLHRRGDAIIAMSDAMRDTYIRKLRTPADRITIIRNCAHRDDFAEPKRDYSRAGSLRVVAMGRLNWVKNHSVLIEAIRLLQEEGVEAELTIIGGGELQSELEGRARSLGVAERVKIPGFVDDARGLIRSSDVYVIPSLMEGCSLSLLEALAGGMPVLASDVPGNREVVERCPAGELLPRDSARAWADALRRVGDMSSDERRALGAAGRSGAQKYFSPETYVRELQDLYVQVMGAKKGLGTPESPVRQEIRP